MTLKGQLKHFGLGELFQTLALNQHTGTLTVEHEGETKIIYFSSGSISLLSTGRSIRIGEILLREGKITEGQLEQALRDQHESGKLFGRVLQERGIVSSQHIEQALYKKVQEELYDLFLWEDGVFEFRPNYCPEELMDPLQRHTRININPHKIVVEGIRQLDEWKIIRTRLPDVRMVVRKKVRKLPAKSELSPLEMTLWERIPKIEAVEQILTRSPETRLQTLKILYRFMDEGWIHALSFVEHLELGRQARKDGELEGAAEIYELLYEGSYSGNREPEFLKEAGSFLVEMGKKRQGYTILEDAIRAYHKVRNGQEAWSVAAELMALSQPSVDLMRTLWSLRSAAPPKSLAKLRKMFVGQLIKESEFLEVETILAEVESEESGNSKYWVRRGEIQRLIGNTQNAIEHYEHALSLMKGGTDLTEMLRVNRMIYDLDSSRLDVRKRLQELLTSQEMRESRMRRRFTVAGVTAISIVVLLFMFPVRYEWEARKLYKKAQILEVASAETHDWAQTKHLYELVVRKYAYSTRGNAAEEAVSRIDKIEEERKRYEMDRRVQENAEQRQIRRKKEREAKKMMGQANSALAHGNVVRARRLFQTLLKDYYHFTNVKKIRFPLRIETVPPGATVKIDGEVVGITPFTFLFRPGSRFKILLERHGCAPQEHRFVDNGEAYFRAELKRAPIDQARFAAIDGLTLATEDAVYVPCRDGWLYATPYISLQQKEALWRRKVGVQGHPPATVSLFRGELLVASFSGLVQLVRKRNGEQIWKYQGDAPITTPARVSPNRRWIAFGDESGAITLLDAKLGTVVARHQEPFPVAALMFRNGNLSVVDRGWRQSELRLPSLALRKQRICDQGISAFSPAGEILLKDGRLAGGGPQKTLPKPMTRVVERDGSLRYGGQGKVWVVLKAGKTTTGPTPVPPASAPFPIGDRIYIAGVDQILYCLDKKGHPMWSMPISGTVCDIQPGPQEVILVFMADGLILILEREQ
ncbi:MAG: DUF4388 domain-containing protein [Planctomycetota bacterium]